MAVLVTMEVGPVDWPKFKAAIDWLRSTPAPGRRSSELYRGEADAGRMLIVEQRDSHAAMHAYQEQVGEEFNRRAATGELDWQTGVWELAESL